MNAWRRERLGVTLGGMLVLLTHGCGAPPTSPTAGASSVMAQQPAAAPAGTSAAALEPGAKPATPAVLPKLPEPGPPLAPLTYDGRGRRDPFAPVRVAVEKPGLDIATAKLVGVIQGRQLLALVELPDGLGYILKPGDVLGNGRVTDITVHSATFAVAGRGGQRDTSVTLKLSGGE